MPVRYVRAPDVLERRSLDAVIVLGAHGEPQVLQGTATAVWEALTAPRSLDELAAHLAPRFDVEASVIAADVQTLLDELVGSGAALTVP